MSRNALMKQLSRASMAPCRNKSYMTWSPRLLSTPTRRLALARFPPVSIVTDIIPAHVNLIKSVTNGVGKVGFNNAKIGRCMTPRRRHGPPTANLSGPFRLLSISDIISDASPATDSITVHRSNCGACKRECVASADGVRVQVVGHEGERASRRTCIWEKWGHIPRARLIACVIVICTVAVRHRRR